ncbi:aminoglycoside phosphotransferase [Sphaerisporangium album]|uniref:Glucosamine kinase n=1 Tax=Sphaerisporangium album TaxID=509200 RepID=A0A367FK70_9ACTN|nr:aminoglycoside phosphotransferase [Sphaerisporangium album]RCG30793.1 aminoglycoside phosphotransferase [Sphaerisporangium album]
MNPSSTDTDGLTDARWPPVAGDGATARLVAALARGARPPEGHVVQNFHPLPHISISASERGLDVDQTNRSVIVDERVVVKWLTPPLPLPQPAPEVYAHLAAVGFIETALPYTALIARDAGGPETLVALMTAYLPEARDGWEWCVDEAEAGRADFAADLGRLAADLHAAMATPSPTFPDPVRHTAPGEAWAVRAERALGEALELTGGEDGAWLAAHAGALGSEFAALGRAGATPLIRIHGDLHVGQVLRWRDGYAVIDFDGNPTVSGAEPFQPAARDLAQLLTSLDHVAQVAIMRRDAGPRRALGWASVARETLLTSYRARLAEAGAPWVLEESLLAAFEIEQECRELIYAARHLPRWRYAPMGVLRARTPGETAVHGPAEEDK